MPHPEPERREHAPPRSSLLDGLTPEQAQAVTYGTGPLLLIAGPGAGKTRTITHRIAHLLESEQARPEQILAVTFSVRAAGELRLRLADLLARTVLGGSLPRRSTPCAPAYYASTRSCSGAPSITRSTTRGTCAG